MVLGAPAIEANQGKRAYGMIQYLPEMRQNMRAMQSRLDQLAEEKAPSDEKDKS